jgi:hypothetical protein
MHAHYETSRGAGNTEHSGSASLCKCLYIMLETIMKSYFSIQFSLHVYVSSIVISSFISEWARHMHYNLCVTNIINNKQFTAAKVTYYINGHSLISQNTWIFSNTAVITSSIAVTNLSSSASDSKLDGQCDKLLTFCEGWKTVINKIH